MWFGAAKEFQTYARECVKLAGQENTPPELRDQLLQMAREWMHAAMGEEETALTLPDPFDESETAGDAAMLKREGRSIVGTRSGEDRRSGRDRLSNAEQR